MKTRYAGAVMSEPPRGHSTSRPGPPSGTPVPRLRTAAELDAVVREFAGRVARLERELADLRELVGGLTEAPHATVGAPAHIR
jgi:hypothetical protein